MWQLAGAAANVLGGIINSIAANQAKHAMQKAYKNETILQRGHRNEAFGTLMGALPSYGVETAREQMASGREHRLGDYAEVGALPFAPSQPRGFGPSGTDKANVAFAGDARANLGSYSDWQLDQMIGQIRLQDELNKINNFAAGDASVFPYKMYDAQHSADWLKFIGDLTSSIGGGAAAIGSASAPPMGGMGGGGASGMFDAQSGMGDLFANIA